MYLNTYSIRKYFKYFDYRKQVGLVIIYIIMNEFCADENFTYVTVKSFCTLLCIHTYVAEYGLRQDMGPKTCFIISIVTLLLLVL